MAFQLPLLPLTINTSNQKIPEENTCEVPIVLPSILYNRLEWHMMIRQRLLPVCCRLLVMDAAAQTADSNWFDIEASLLPNAPISSPAPFLSQLPNQHGQCGPDRVYVQIECTVLKRILPPQIVWKETAPYF